MLLWLWYGPQISISVAIVLFLVFAFNKEAGWVLVIAVVLSPLLGFENEAAPNQPERPSVTNQE